MAAKKTAAVPGKIFHFVQIDKLKPGESQESDKDMKHSLYIWMSSGAYIYKNVV